MEILCVDYERYEKVLIFTFDIQELILIYILITQEIKIWDCLREVKYLLKNALSLIFLSIVKRVILINICSLQV